jgi:muramoyltetrapeptide carboxypeptidase
MKTEKKISLLPTRLKPGDRVGIVAPASPFSKKAFFKGVRVLESLGYEVYIPGGLFSRKGYLAGSDSHRACLVNSLFQDSAINAIACARGGFGSLRMLSMLDFKAIRKNPKIFIGFSDITAILWALYTRCGLVTFHGPVLTALGDATGKSQRAMFSAFSTDAKIRITSKKKGSLLKPGSAIGPVAGGNLTTLCHLLGTPFEPAFKDHILFLEETGEASYRIDRMLSQMKLAGCFRSLAGLVLGVFKNCGRLSTVYKIVEDIFYDQNVPILAGFEIGHVRNNITVPVGLEGTLDGNRQQLEFHMPATRI